VEFVSGWQHARNYISTHWADWTWMDRRTKISRISSWEIWQPYIGRNDVTDSMVAIRSPFCTYNTIYSVELNGEDLSCYSNKTESVSLRKCPPHHRLTNKAYLSAITAANISRSFYLQDGGKNQLAQIWNKITLLSPYVYVHHIDPTYLTQPLSSGRQG